MDLSPHIIPEGNSGLGEVCNVLCGVLLQHRAGLTVKELRVVLKDEHGLDLEELRKDLGFGTIISFLAQLPCCRLLHPEQHGNCVITYTLGTEYTDPVHALKGAMEECWYEDTFPESFLPTSSPTQLHQGSPEKPSPAQPQKSMSPQVHHHKAPDTAGTIRTSAHLVASTPPAARHPAGTPDGPTGVSPGRLFPVPTSSLDPSPSRSPAVPPEMSPATPSAGPRCHTRPPGLDVAILRVVIRPGFSSGLRVQKLTEILSEERGICLEKLSQELGYGDLLDLLQQVPNVRLMDPTKGDQCVIRFQPGLDEEILRVVTRPGFSSGLRVQKLTEILSEEQGICLEELSQGLGYGDLLDLLQQVPNVTLMDPTKEDQCVIKFQPGSRGNVGQLLPYQMASAPVTSQGQRLKTELEEFPYSSSTHEFLYPVTQLTSQKQTPSMSQNRVNPAAKHPPTAGQAHPSQKSKGFPVTIYTSKHHQKPWPPQQKKKPGAAMVFRASKPPSYAGALRAYQNSPDSQRVHTVPSQKTAGPPKAYAMPLYPSPKNPADIPQGGWTAQLLPNHTPPGPSHDKATTAPHELPACTASQTQGPCKDLDPILKDEILVVLLQQPAGVCFGEFGGLFHRTHGYQFKLSHHGFTSLRALLEEMKDLVTVSEEPIEPLITCKGQHHFVFIGGGPFSSRV